MSTNLKAIRGKLSPRQRFAGYAVAAGAALAISTTFWMRDADNDNQTVTPQEQAREASVLEKAFVSIIFGPVIKHQMEREFLYRQSIGTTYTETPQSIDITYTETPFLQEIRDSFLNAADQEMSLAVMQDKTGHFDYGDGRVVETGPIQIACYPGYAQASFTLPARGYHTPLKITLGRECVVPPYALFEAP